MASTKSDTRPPTASRIKSFFGTQRPNRRSRTPVMGNKSKVSSSATNLRATGPQETIATSELSLEQIVSKEGYINLFVKVFCERIRKGDHFKTLGIVGSTTAEQCVKSLVETHFSKFGSPQDFELCEVLGVIESIKSFNGQDSLWGFTELKVRRIEPMENIKAVFQNTCPGPGLTRRLELRFKERSADAPLRPSSAMQQRGPIIRPEPSPTNHSPQGNLIRTNSQISTTPQLRDSRRIRLIKGMQVPHGPHLILLRGSRPSQDIVVHDLSRLVTGIQNPQTFITVGTKTDADIRLYPTPDEREPTMTRFYARLVGPKPEVIDNQTLSNVRGLIYIEPDLRDDFNANTNHPFNIYINEEQINQSGTLLFNKRELRPGDLVSFGSLRSGYVFLFKDPRRVPDHKLELPFVQDRVFPYVEQSMLQQRRTSLNLTTPDIWPRSRSINGSFSKGEPLPIVNEVKWILNGLFMKIKTSPNANGNQDVFTIPQWENSRLRIEPGRSACFLGQMTRALALVKLSPEKYEDACRDVTPFLPGDVIREIVTTLPKCYDDTEASSNNLIVPNIWLCEFAYDLATYLSPGWLVHRNPTRLVNGRKVYGSNRVDLNSSTSSQSSSPGPSSPSKSPESLPEIVDLRNLAFVLATRTLDKVIRVICQTLLPYLPALYESLNDQSSPENSPIHSNWSNGLAELCRLLDRLASCFDAAFFPKELSETEIGLVLNGSQISTTGRRSSKSGPVCSTPVNKPNGYNSSKPRRCSSPKSDDISDPSWSMETDTDNEVYAYPSNNTTLDSNNLNGHDSIPSDYSQKNGNHLTSVKTSSKSTGKGNSTFSRIEAIIWRQLLATISHDILHTLLVTDTVKLNWETGLRLLNGVSWLQDWLKVHNLDKHKRPLNILIQTANLLGTPRPQLCMMSWLEMRNCYPDIPPSLLRCILENYEDGAEVDRAPNWAIDTQDATAVDEEPSEVIELALKGWKSKEQLRTTKSYVEQTPTYRPLKPEMWLKLVSTKELVVRLDHDLKESKSQILFRWEQLLSHFQPPKVIQEPNGDGLFNSSNPRVRSKSSFTSRKRLPLRIGHRLDTSQSMNFINGNQIPSQNGYPSVSNNHNDVNYSPLPNKTDISQFDSTPSFEFRNYSKPVQSNQEPVWHRNQLPGTNRDSISQADRQRAALYHAGKLAASLQGIDFRGLLPSDDAEPIPDQVPRKNSLPQNRLDDYDYTQTHNYSTATLNQWPRNENQPDLMFNQRIGARTASPYYDDPRLQRSNILSQSLGDFSNGFRLDRDQRQFSSRLDINQLAEVADDWNKYRQSTLGRGLERIRNAKLNGNRSITPSGMRDGGRLVSSSMANLPTYLNPPPHLNPPTLTIQEASDSSPVSDLEGSRQNDDDDDDEDDLASSINHLDAVVSKEDLADVLMRNSLGSAVTNITLSKSRTEEFGLSLVDGMRTALDHPGVFVKDVKPNSVAAINGHFGPGDQILAINGQNLTGMTYLNALSLLKNCKENATFTVLRCRLSDPSKLTQIKQA